MCQPESPSSKEQAQLGGDFHPPSRPDAVGAGVPIVVGVKEDSGDVDASHASTIEVGLVLLFAIYAGVYRLNPQVMAAANHCPTGTEPCQRPDLVAYKVTSAMCMIYMGLTGLYNWHCSPRIRQLSAKEGEAAKDRLFGRVTSAERQNMAIFCYQVWDLCVSWTIPEHASPIFMTHHALAAVCAWYSLRHKIVPYYAVYFGGCSEFSSIFLIFCDLEDMFPSLGGTPSISIFIQVCQALFVITFFCYRVVGWWWVSSSLWSDSLQALTTGTAEKRGHARFLYMFLAINVLLGGLQLYWFGEILAKVSAMTA